MRIVRFWLILLAVATLLSLSAAAYDRSRIATADQCTLFAATNGSDSNSGSESDPFASVQKLVNSLEPNETGCLKKGTYTESDDTVDITAGGTETKPITLTTAPDEGEPARINAELYTNDAADYWTFDGLYFDGSYGPPCSADAACTIMPAILLNGDYNTLRNSEVTNRRPSQESTMAGTCVHTNDSGGVYGLVVKNNNIHHCGRLPRSNYDHGVYLSYSREAQVLGNKIWANADKGINLRIDADGTLIKNNVIDGNSTGIMFAGEDGKTSDNNEARNNLITFAYDRYNVESWYPSGTSAGTGNSVHDNCIYGGARGDFKSPGYGYTEYDNTIADPLYTNQANHDYTVRNDLCLDVQGGTLADGLRDDNTNVRTE